MSEGNDYVATAAAEKRLREVLAERLPHHTEVLVEELAVALLDGAKIEYKPRTKTILISLDVPETAAIRKPKSDAAADAGQAFSPDDTADNAAVPETVKASPIPHITAFVPAINPNVDYEDVHFD